VAWLPLLLTAHSERLVVKDNVAISNVSSVLLFLEATTLAVVTAVTVVRPDADEVIFYINRL
jgi:hypothetical protein